MGKNSYSQQRVKGKNNDHRQKPQVKNEDRAVNKYSTTFFSQPTIPSVDLEVQARLFIGLCATQWGSN